MYARTLPNLAWSGNTCFGTGEGVFDPFSEGEADVGFMCSPSFSWLRELRASPVELLGVAPVFQDERASGKLVYFCEAIVHQETPIHSFAEFKGRS